MSEQTWQRWFWWLRSRKVQTALATVVAAILAQWGLNASEEAVAAIIAVGTAVILGIAHEDNGEKQGM